MGSTVFGVREKLDLVKSAFLGFPGGSDNNEFTCSMGDLGWIPGLGRSAGEENGYHSSILAWRIPWTGEPGRL